MSTLDVYILGCFFKVALLLPLHFFVAFKAILIKFFDEPKDQGGGHTSNKLEIRVSMWMLCKVTFKIIRAALKRT